MPLLQGQMDGLCGLYSVLNAVEALWPRVPLEHVQRRCIKALDNWPGAYLNGTYTRNIEEMLEAVRKYINRSKRFQGRMVFMRPYTGRIDRESFLEDLEHRLADEDTIAIVGFAGNWQHWTVCKQIDQGFLRLIDSTGYHNIRCRDIGLHGSGAPNVVSYSTTFIVRRMSSNTT